MKKQSGIGVIHFIVLIMSGFMSFGQDYEPLRHRMVTNQIVARGVSDGQTLDAMRHVERHRFVPEHLQKKAYDDTPLPIGHGQTISQPYIVALMTELLQPEANHRVLEIGAGSGYQAAVLAEIVDSVYTIEIVPELAELTRDLMKRLDYENVHVITGDGYVGLPDKAPFDAIIVTAAPDEIPAPLLAQLKEGGRMVIPIGSPRSVQELLFVEKVDGKIRRRTISYVQFVPFTRDTL